jgi:hypothetical protein
MIDPKEIMYKEKSEQIVKLNIRLEDKITQLNERIEKMM